MKVKNIMFSGAMASILMIGGAYADTQNQTTAEPTQFTTTGLSTDSRLASAQYVKEGVAEAEDYAKTYANHMVHSLDANVTQSANTNGLSASVTEVDGKLDSVSVSVTAADNVSSNNAKLITSGVVYSGAKNALYDNNGENNAARSIADVIAANESAIASLQTQAGTGTVGDQIDTKINALNQTVNTADDSKVVVSVAEEKGLLKSVTASLANGAVGTDQIDAKAVTTVKIADGAVTATQIDTSAVTTDKIADDAVTAAKIADDAVGTDQIAASAVTSTEIAANAVVTAKIADANVTKAKLASDVQESLGLADTAIQTDDLNAALKNAGVSGLEEGSYIDLTTDEDTGKTTIAVTNVATSWNGGATPSN
ncbi:MAG: hypothetical protein KBS86_03440 [Proteobacteria bacterium]|nr:hypothetical protein [Candidatus Enterousia scatequi]